VDVRTTAFCDELTKLARKKKDFMGESALPAPTTRELRKSWIHRLLAKFGLGKYAEELSAEDRDLLRRRDELLGGRRRPPDDDILKRRDELLGARRDDIIKRRDELLSAGRASWRKPTPAPAPAPVPAPAPAPKPKPPRVAQGPRRPFGREFFGPESGKRLMAPPKYKMPWEKVGHHTKAAGGAIEDAKLLDRGLGAVGGGVAGGLTAGAAGAGIGQLIGRKADPAQVAKLMSRSPTARKTGERLLRWSIAGTPMQKRIAKLILSGKVKPAALVGLGIGLTGGTISGAIEGAKKP